MKSNDNSINQENKIKEEQLIINSQNTTKNIDDLIINPITNDNINNNINEIDDSVLIKKYIGQNADKIINNQFSIPGFFFAEFYLFYRKMFLYGFLVIILKTILTIASLTEISFVINIVIGLTANKLYLHYIKTKINKIKNNNNNSDLEKICSEKGGTNVLTVIGGIILEIVLAVVAILITLLFGLGTLFGGIIGDIISSSSGKINNTYRDTILFDSETNLNEIFNITIPAEFQNESSDSTLFDYQYNSNASAILGKCTLSLGIVSNANSAKEYATSMAKHYSVSNMLNNMKINNINWYTLSYESVGKEFAYISEINNKVYLYTFNIQEDADYEICNSYNTSIINSISLK